MRVTGKVPEMLANAPTLPDEVAYLWDWFIELHSARASSGFGIQPISYLEIKAWSQLNQIHLTPWELHALKRLDGACIKTLSEK